MFENIKNRVIGINNEAQNEQEHKLGILTNVFEKRNIIIYIIAFMISIVSFDGTFSIFSISLLGACLASNIPAGGVILMSLAGNSIIYGVEGVLGYFLTTLVLIISMLIFKPKYNEKERNEKIKIGKNILIATLVIQTVGYIFGEFTLYDVLSSITISMIAMVFYKIFVNSVSVLQDFREKRAFTIEEVIGASIIFAIALGAFGDINILGFGIRNIFSILIVMILGWKNGILVGTTAGVTIGVTLGVITGTEPIMIAAYAISGMIAGILNKFGKIGVVVGFILGNVLLAYVSNGYTVELILFKEILIASIGLLAVPKTFEIKLEEFIGDTKFLPAMPNRALNRNKEMAENLNNMSEIIQDMATTYKKVENASFGPNTDINANKQIFMAELLNNLEPHRENILYEDVADTDGKISEGIFVTLLEKQELDKNDLVEIFKNANSYILGIEDEDPLSLTNGAVAEVLRVINFSYRVSKSDFIWKKRIEQNQKVLGKQLNKVSTAIKNMAKDLEKEVDEENKFEQEKNSILELIKENNISVNDIVIKKEQRYFLDIYINDNLNKKLIETLEKLSTQILKESIVFNQEASVGSKISLISEDKYSMAIGVSTASKSKSEMSGDTTINVRLKDGKNLIAISDGMGTGRNAKKSSNDALKMLENMLISGFDKNTSIDLINSMLMNKNEEIYATLDIAIIDLYTGVIEFIKSAACPTYLKNDKKVQIIKSSSLPTGIVEDAETQVFDRDIQDGDIVLMCSDGIIDSNIEYKNKELWVKYMLEDIETVNTTKIADIILNEAVDNNFGAVKDDMSIVVCKFKKK